MKVKTISDTIELTKWIFVATASFAFTLSTLRSQMGHFSLSFHISARVFKTTNVKQKYHFRIVYYLKN
jgi:hypothetical protein